MRLKMDHLAVCAETLAEGVDYVETLLGVAMAPGGEHAKMGTHNRLLSLGPDCYLEVIAINPDAMAPDHPRWFDMDNFSGEPRLTNWICQVDSMDDLPAGLGQPMSLQRGDLRWQMAVPHDGRLPFNGAFPAAIKWAGSAHPNQRLPDSGCTLGQLNIRHPEVEDLRAELEPNLITKNVTYSNGDLMLSAVIATPSGLKVLQ